MQTRQSVVQSTLLQNLRKKRRRTILHEKNQFHSNLAFHYFPSTSLLICSSLTLCRPDRVSFKVPMQKIYPKKGDVVTFTYDNYTTKSVPLNPRISRIRTDMTWEEAIFNFEQQISDSAATNGTFHFSNFVLSEVFFWYEQNERVFGSFSCDWSADLNCLFVLRNSFSA